MIFITENDKILKSNVISRPIFQLEEIDIVHEDVMKNLDKNLVVSPDIIKSFQIKNTLNPEIWDNDTLKPQIKNKLIKLGKDFFKSLELPKNIKIKDILFVGSLANYNWSKFSDIDLHIVVDFDDLNSSQEQTKKSFDAQKNLWNLKHDIDVFDYPVEVYIQDVKEKLESSAVYSIPHDKWIVKPKLEKFKLDKKLIINKVDKLFDKLKNIKQEFINNEYQNVVDKAENLKNYIKKMRKAGLESGGEYSTENIIFKILRRTDFMEILDNYKNKAYDNDMTINEEYL